ncbi:hypothetical protein PIECOFPK_02812 [Mycovorax composti]|jgi:hypothetical protein|uniref:RagB/SusD family nutrient uptake outer membrane protein n=1 Tax=Mycovorax composti TaxID=2962693 RepID=A0ABZ2EPB6_9BACT
MRLKAIILGVSVICCSLLACVKDEPFIPSYTVPPTYDFEDIDSIITARLIMLHGVKNYLLSGTDSVLNAEIATALWTNTDSAFTPAMVPNFIYKAERLNRMRSTNLSGDTRDADILKSFIDSAVTVSASHNVAGSNGVPGWQMLSNPSEKRLFSSIGIEYTEVWEKAMLGAMCLYRVNSQLSNPANATAWAQAFHYSGIPRDYDPTINYGDSPNRPLAIATLFPNAESIQAGSKIFEDFRRGRAAVNAGDLRVATLAKDSLLLNIEKVFALSAIHYLDAAKDGNTADKLYNLSRAFGTIIALNYRSSKQLLNDEAYIMILEVFDNNFYTLIQNPTAITNIRNVLATAYEFH